MSSDSNPEGLNYLENPCLGERAACPEGVTVAAPQGL